MSKVKNLSATRQQRGVVHMSVTRLEDRFNILEANDMLTSSDRVTLERLSKKIEALDAEFKDHHYAVIDLVGYDEQILDDEQPIMDDNEDKVAEIIERLQQLRPKSKATLLTAHSTNQCVLLGK